ncbi:unnamed protein product [Gongylonema pulchrum]|uniref:Ovule protein n=1 Tax=Gongylonema pulchrum TaxID=637853 RepID=A0A183ECL2_9BILA|nr:unnamed protein product [Gongylonema pulchrum]
MKLKEKFVDLLDGTLMFPADATVEMEDDALSSSSGSGERSEPAHVANFSHNQLLQRTSVQNPRQMFPAEQTLDIPSHSHYHTEHSPRYQTASVQDYLLPNEDPSSVVANAQQSLANLLLRMVPAEIPFPEISRRTCFGILEVQQKLKVQNASSKSQLTKTRVDDVETAMPSNSNTLRETNTVLSNTHCGEEIECKEIQHSDSSPGRSKPQLFKWSQSRNSPAIEPGVALKRRLDTEQNIILGGKLLKPSYSGQQSNSPSRSRNYK